VQRIGMVRVLGKDLLVAPGGLHPFATLVELEGRFDRDGHSRGLLGRHGDPNSAQSGAEPESGIGRELK
jgi:hypothetical protein